mmetsp:Transcript_8742/g.28123  ORF Transcript_8742/g.28123 Transcript_8742/m.28123 type:complete len:255 (+) Transcript_8742:337-1101(+)
MRLTRYGGLTTSHRFAMHSTFSIKTSGATKSFVFLFIDSATTKSATRKTSRKGNKTSSKRFFPRKLFSPLTSLHGTPASIRCTTLYLSKISRITSSFTFETSSKIFTPGLFLRKIFRFSLSRSTASARIPPALRKPAMVIPAPEYKEMNTNVFSRTRISGAHETQFLLRLFSSRNVCLSLMRKRGIAGKTGIFATRAAKNAKVSTSSNALFVPLDGISTFNLDTKARTECATRSLVIVCHCGLLSKDVSITLNI